MDINKITIKQADKYQTILYTHYTNSPKGSIVVLHGMAEHHDRYNAFAKYMNKQGYDVYLYDHRGHGIDKKIEELGLFSEYEGYKLVICDAIEVLKYVSSHNRGEKLILFGHSMGSIIARNVIEYYDDIDGCIICGTSNPANFVLKFGLMYAGWKLKTKGPLSRLPKLAKLITGSKKYTSLSTRTAFDWLTRDNTIVGSYINDPYCGYLCTTAFYHDLLKLNLLAGTKKLMKKTRYDLPILIISGSNDPVGNFGKDIAKLFSTYQKLMFTNVDCTIYDECRHELLNEINNVEVMKDILTWIESSTNEQKSEQAHQNAPILAESVTEAKSINELVRDSMKEIEPEETDGEKKLAQIRKEKELQHAQQESEQNEEIAEVKEEESSEE